MEITQVLGYVGALMIGLVLGLIGGGGSILTIPILVYLFYIEPVMATAYSLFVVGVSSGIGSVKNLRKNLIDFKTVRFFAIPAVLTVYTTRRYIVPAIPEELGHFAGINFTRGGLILVFFALLMFVAGWTMIRKKSHRKNTSVQNYPLLIVLACVTGFFTALVGAGGGFIIVPILALLGKLPMKNAIATSLIIVTLNSLIGFVGDIQNLQIDWVFLLPFTILPIIGIFIGMWLQQFVNEGKLKKAFGWFILLMSIYIIYKEASL